MKGGYKVEIDDLDNTFATGGEYELQCAVEIYGQSILRYCHNILCDYFEAQDVVQITFIKAYNRRKSFREGTSLSAWLYRIAYTTCIDLLRKKKLLFFMPQRNVESIFAISLKDEHSDHINADLKQALLTLSPEDRALIFSRVIDEKSYMELEELYRVPAATLRKRYERAKKKLSKALQEINPYYEKLEGIK